MDGSKLISSLRLTGFLSYGRDGMDVALGPLNVLIGPNASGKSNFIAAMELLRATPDDITAPFRQGGGSSEWVWKGEDYHGGASVLATVPLPGGQPALIHEILFTTAGQRFLLEHEAIGVSGDAGGLFFSRTSDQKAELLARTSPSHEIGSMAKRAVQTLGQGEINLNQSILSQRRDPQQYPEITYLGETYRGIRIYRNWDVGKRGPLRTPQAADHAPDFLYENGSNLGLVLNDLENRPDGLQNVVTRLRRCYDRVERITVKVHGGTVQVFLHEVGLDEPVPQTRMSDGLLRYLCLLTILCHPSPPPLICIEEPELGLHPDVMSVLGDLLIEASQRTQLIVTTHSDLLVSALSDVPEAVLVCERDDRGTHLRRLEKDKLKEWLEEHSLGDLWLRGEIGGTRF